jgi:AraC family transcriptional regulator
MSPGESYRTGLQGLRDYFHLKASASEAVRALRGSKFSTGSVRADELHMSNPTPTLSGSAFILSLQRSDCADHDVRIREHPIPVVPFPKGMMSLVKLTLDPSPTSRAASDDCSFYLQRDSFDRLADDLGVSRIDGLAIAPGVAVNDPVVVNLGPCLLSAIERPEEANTMFVQHVAIALHTHLAQRYGGMRIPRTSGSGSLTPWQLRLTRDTINAHLDGGVSLARLARDCGLSVSHFARAFTCSTGLPPHRWLTQRRVDRAKDLMRSTKTPLAEIALACGFSDQGHFTRVFSHVAGATPSQWRRVTTN